MLMAGRAAPMTYAPDPVRIVSVSDNGTPSEMSISGRIPVLKESGAGLEICGGDEVAGERRPSGSWTVLASDTASWSEDIVASEGKNPCVFLRAGAGGNPAGLSSENFAPGYPAGDFTGGDGKTTLIQCTLPGSGRFIVSGDIISLLDATARVKRVPFGAFAFLFSFGSSAPGGQVAVDLSRLVLPSSPIDSLAFIGTFRFNPGTIRGLPALPSKNPAKDSYNGMFGGSAVSGELVVGFSNFSHNACSGWLGRVFNANVTFVCPRGFELPAMRSTSTIPEGWDIRYF